MPSNAQDEIDSLRLQIAELERIERDRLRQQVLALEQAERGAAQAPAPAAAPTPASAYSSPRFKNFTVSQEEARQEVSNAQIKKAHVGTNSRKYVSYVVGIAMLVGIVGAIIALKNFMQSNDIQFVQGDAGTAMITPEELALHNTPDDCWMVLYGDVYDLTNYARRHPGGASIVTDLAGKDGTAEYERFHSESLLRSVQGDIVGTLSTGGSSGASGGGGGGGGSSNNNGGGGGDSPPAAGGCTAGEANCVTIAELSNHNTADDCWMAINGNVYDLTAYARRHPGGAGIVTRFAGTDATTEYRRYHSFGLLSDVRDTLVGPYEGGVEAGANNNQGGGMEESSPDSGD